MTGSEGFCDVTAERRARVGRPRVGLHPPALAVPLSVACGSDAWSSNSKQPQASTAVWRKAWSVLADGPDPDVDPVGNALSKIELADRIHTSDRDLAQRLFDLTSADRALLPSYGSDHAATKSMAKGDTDLNKGCPEVAS